MGGIQESLCLSHVGVEGAGGYTGIIVSVTCGGRGGWGVYRNHCVCHMWIVELLCLWALSRTYLLTHQLFVTQPEHES